MTQLRISHYLLVQVVVVLIDSVIAKDQLKQNGIFFFGINSILQRKVSYKANKESACKRQNISSERSNTQQNLVHPS